MKVLHHVRSLRSELPVMVRTRDESHVKELQAAGAAEVVPETLEASLMIASQALLLLDVPLSRVMRRMQDQRTHRYRLLREFYRSDSVAENPEERGADRLRPVTIPADSSAVGRTIGEFDFDGVVVTALVRQGERLLSPSRDTRLEGGDALVFSAPRTISCAPKERFSDKRAMVAVALRFRLQRGKAEVSWVRVVRMREFKPESARPVP